jgi:hypothetical protein
MTPDAEVATVNRSNGTHDLINNLLQVNCISADLETLRQKAMDQESSWTVHNGLLLFNNQLVVLENNELKVRLLSEAHNQVSTAYLG